jgi:hypothetical protein
VSGASARACSRDRGPQTRSGSSHRVTVAGRMARQSLSALADPTPRLAGFGRLAPRPAAARPWPQRRIDATGPRTLRDARWIAVG